MADKFKAGDKVELVDAVGMAAEKGATATVTGYKVEFPSTRYVQIEWDRNGLDHGQRNGGYHDKDFALVVKKKRYAAQDDHVVMLCRDGHYLPSTEPRVMGREQAIKVAKIMCKKHGGKFVVFKAVAHAVAPKVVEPTVIEFN